MSNKFKIIEPLKQMSKSALELYSENNDARVTKHPGKMKSRGIPLREKRSSLRCFIRLLLFLPVVSVLLVLKCYQLYTIWEIWSHQRENNDPVILDSPTNQRYEFVSRYTLAKSGKSFRRQDFMRPKRENYCYTPPEPTCGC